MSHDLERALADLADAAERSARHGILAQPALPFTLHRVVGRVRRRRATRAATAGAVALVVLAGGAGAVDYGLSHDRTWPPAVTPLPTAVTDFCGTPDEDLHRIASAEDTIVFQNLTSAVVSTADPFHFVAHGVSYRTESFVVDADQEDSDAVLLTQGGVVTAAGFVGGPVWDRSTVVNPGGAIVWDGPAVVYNCSTLDGVTRAGAGDYEMWLVSDLTVDGEALKVAGGPWPIALSDDDPSPGPTLLPSPGPELTACGASDEGLYALDDPFTTSPLVGITAPPITPVAVRAVPDLTITVDNVDAERVSLGTANPRVVLTRDHVIVGGAPFGAGSPGSALAGESTEFSLTAPPTACPIGGDALVPDGPALAQGEYEVWVLLTVRQPGAGQDTVAVGGPFALTLTDPFAEDPAAAVFPCGQPLGFTAESVPAAGGLTLTADLPATGWLTFGAGASWSAMLGTDEGQTILANVSRPAHVAFTDDQGVVVGRTYSGDGSVDLFTAGPGASAELYGATESARCGPDGKPVSSGEISLPAGTYWAWPYATAFRKEVQPAVGEAYSPPAGVVVVVGAPTRVTLRD